MLDREIARSLAFPIGTSQYVGCRSNIGVMANHVPPVHYDAAESVQAYQTPQICLVAATRLSAGRSIWHAAVVALTASCRDYLIAKVSLSDSG